MALYTPGYAGIKQGLLLQAPHRIPNTMEPRTSALAVTSFLQENATLSVMHFLPNLLALSIDGVQCDRSDAPMFILTCVRDFSLTYSQDKVVVRLVVDGIQDVKHLDGKIRHCA